MASSKYQDLKAQLVELEAQAEHAREAELAAVLAEVREKVATYGLTAKQVFGAGRKTPPASKRPKVPPMYRDPKTGAEWSGRGRAPAWIAGAKKRERFLIEK